MDDFSDHPDYSDPEQNLTRLKETQKFLSTVDANVISREWMKEHCSHILYYSWAISKANPGKESDSSEYQRVVKELITLLDSLTRSIRTTGTFSIQQYMSAVGRLLRVIEEATSMYELEDAMNDLLT